MGLSSFTAFELGTRIQKKEIAVMDAVEEVFKQIDLKEKDLHCYVTVTKEKAMESALLIQKRINQGECVHPLAGVPMAVKDNLCTEGVLTTCSSRMLSDFTPTYSAEAVRKLENAGAILIGKTNMDEFAMGSTCETSFYGFTRNPWNGEYASGGSSGGSAAAVASCETFFSLGSDTGGSIRLPASYCGVVGLKPTYGTVSRYGLIAYASSFDQIGPLCKDVMDCAVLLETIAGKDEKDATTINRGNLSISRSLSVGVQGIRIGIPTEYLQEGVQREVRDAVLRAASVLKFMGAEVEEFRLGLVDAVIPAYYTIASAEASSNLERFDGVKYGYCAKEANGLHQMYKQTRANGFGSEVKRRIMLGTFVLSAGYYDAYYLKALKVKRLIKMTFDRAFEKYDILLGPVAPTTAPLLGESLRDPVKMCLSDIDTVSANLTGIPAMSLPYGLDDKGLPIGIQLMANSFQERTLLNVAYSLESERKEDRRRVHDETPI